MRKLLALVSIALLSIASLPLYAEQDTQFLAPEVAFSLSVEAIHSNEIQLQIHVEPEHYVYADKFKFVAPDWITLGVAQLPAPDVRMDQFSGKEKAVFHHDIDITLPYHSVNSVQAGPPFELVVRTQGCAEAGLCYPPFTQKVIIDPTVITPAAKSKSTAEAPGKTSALPTGEVTITAVQVTQPPAVIADESSRIQSVLNDGSTWLTLLTFFGFGILLALTPCVFPMIPILSGIIIGQGENITKQRAAKMSLAYVLGMAVTYAVAGVLAGLSGTLLSAALQNIWVLSGFALVFVVLSLSMFDVFQLQLPAGLQGKLSDSANRKGGSLTGVVFMGALSALIIGPCVAAPLAGALLYIAKTGDAVLGGSALFSMALGMGLPLIVIGVAARTLLPRAGVWMVGIKRLFGVLLLAVAIWIVSPVASALIVMLAIAMLTLFCAVFLRAFDPLPDKANASQKLGKGVGIISAVVGTSMLIGVLSGTNDPLAPLSFLQVSSNRTGDDIQQLALPFKDASSMAQLNSELSQSEKPILLDFYADWCVSCKEMEHFTFTDTEVQQRMQRFTLVQADVTENTDQHKRLLKQFDLFGPPAIVVLTPRGQEISRVIGYKKAEDFVTWLESVEAAVKTSTL